MPFLAGGYHLPLASKIAISNTSFLLMAGELIDDEDGWVDNLEDTMAILQFAGTMYVLWLPPAVQAGIAAKVGILLAPLAVPTAMVTSVVIVGGVIAYFVDPEEGLKNYKDFLTEPTKIPERLKFTAETIYEHKIEPTVNVTLGIAAMLYRMAVNEVERRVTALEEGAAEAVEFIEDLPGIWFNPTPGAPWL